MMTRTRISKYLAECGIGSRRKCEKLVLEGKVKVNGTVLKDLSYRVAPEDRVVCLNQKIEPQPKTVIALNKPPGYLSTVKDDFNRKKVTDLIKKEIRLYPVGRLDYKSRGLIIMTNDGSLSYRLTHPKFMVPKTYKVKVEGYVQKKDISKLIEGIEIEEVQVNVISLKVIDRTADKSTIIMEIVEGRKRIIRRVFKKLGYRVVDLQRTKIGNFDLGNLKEGEYMVLNHEQIKDLTTARLP